jgi:aminoglycoside phosphotransferase (APT) family kinase protein
VSRTPDAALRDFVARSGLVPAGVAVEFARLTGGVSSDIWRVCAGSREFCVKRALPKLRVAAEWYAPIERNAKEAAWLRTAGRILPDATPTVLFEDAAAATFAMSYFEPAQHPVWKAQLHAGIVEPATVAAVGERLGRIHRETADSPMFGRIFATDAIFDALRLRPYLLQTGLRHPDIMPILEKIATTTAKTRRCLVHGDISPKNILVGPKGPIFLDAECAWYGDPAFDLAFCLNHLLLKSVWVPAALSRLLGAFDALIDAYRPFVAWEDFAALEARAADLVPALALARIDGSSPVEYITTTAKKDRVRRVARRLLRGNGGLLATVRHAWMIEMNEDYWR